MAKSKTPAPAPMVSGERRTDCLVVPEPGCMTGVFWPPEGVTTTVGIPVLSVGVGTGVFCLNATAVAVTVGVAFVGVTVIVGMAVGVVVAVASGVGLDFGPGVGEGVGVAVGMEIVTPTDALSTGGEPFPAFAWMVAEPEMLHGTLNVNEKEPLPSESCEPNSTPLPPLPACNMIATEVPPGR